jgi:hypothetical protein
MMDRQPQPGAAGGPWSSRTPDLCGFLSRDTPGMANLKTDGPYSPRPTLNDGISGRGSMAKRGKAP